MKSLVEFQNLGQVYQFYRSSLEPITTKVTNNHVVKIQDFACKKDTLAKVLEKRVH